MSHVIFEYQGEIYNTNNGYVITTIGKHARRFKKPEVAKYQKEIEKLASTVKHYFDNFDSKRHYIKLNLYWYNPKFFNKDGSLNKRAGDTDGIVKFIKDGIAKGIDLDDAFFKCEQIIQLPSSDINRLSVELSQENLHTLLSEFKLNYT